MDWLKRSLWIQVLLAAYFQAILWFPLGAWNDQPGRRLYELLREGEAFSAVWFALAMILPVLLFALALAQQWVWLIWVGLIGYSTWAWLEIQSWWMPWIFGADQRAINNQRFLERTYKIFPYSYDHPAPDGMHFVLDVLVFLVVVTIALGLLERGSETA